jgi:hypothetical protein
MRTAADVMTVYDRADLLKMLSAAGGMVELPFNFTANNQGNSPDCWDFSAVQMAQVAINLIDGSTTVLDCSLGPIVTGNTDGGGIEDLWLQVGNKYGFPSAADMGTNPLVLNSDGSPNIITSKRNLPFNWQQLAAKRTGIESVELPSSEALASAILNKHPGNGGVAWEGSGGHAIGCLLVALASWVQKLSGWHGRKPPRPGDSDDLYFGTPSTWGDWSSGGEWGAFPGRSSWYLLSESQFGAAWSGPTYGCYSTVGIQDQTAAA